MFWHRNINTSHISEEIEIKIIQFTYITVEYPAVPATNFTPEMTQRVRPSWRIHMYIEFWLTGGCHVFLLLQESNSRKERKPSTTTNELSFNSHGRLLTVITFEFHFFESFPSFLLPLGFRLSDNLWPDRHSHPS